VPKCTYPNTFAKDLLLLELVSIPLKYSCNLCDERRGTDYYWRPRPFIKTVRLREKHPAIGVVRDFEIKLTPPPRLVCAPDLKRAKRVQMGRGVVERRIEDSC
jgi:hypothetical protein